MTGLLIANLVVSLLVLLTLLAIFNRAANLLRQGKANLIAALAAQHAREAANGQPV